MIPEAKLPSLPLPAIRSLPTIPHVGAAPGDASSLVGEQFGNLPDLNSILHIKALRKSLEEIIYTLLKGQLPFATRPPVYATREAQLIAEVAELVSAMNTIVGQVTTSVNAAIGYANQQLTAVNQAKAAIDSVPAAARGPVQKLMRDRYNRYATELNAQIARHQQTLAALA
jgi:hypothetical protein